MQLNELLAILSKRRFGVIAVVMLTVAFSAALALVTPPKYEATTTLALTPKIDTKTGLISATDLTALLSTYAETAKSRVNRSRAQQVPQAQMERMGRQGRAAPRVPPAPQDRRARTEPRDATAHPARTEPRAPLEPREQTVSLARMVRTGSPARMGRTDCRGLQDWSGFRVFPASRD